MLAFEVKVNNERLYIAGHRDATSLYGVVFGSATHPGAVVSASVGVPSGDGKGTATLTYKSKSLQVGDEVTIRIVDVDGVDQPERRDVADYKIEIEEDATGKVG